MALTKCPYCQDQHVCHTHDSQADTAAVQNIVFYIGYRAGIATERLPLVVRPSDIQIPARDILDLIQGLRTLEQVVADADEE